MLTQPIQCGHDDSSKRQFIGSINRLDGKSLLGSSPVSGGFSMRTTRSNPCLRAWWGLWRLRTAIQWLSMAGSYSPDLSGFGAARATWCPQYKKHLKCNLGGVETSLAPLYRMSFLQFPLFLGGVFLFHHYPNRV